MADGEGEPDLPKQFKDDLARFAQRGQGAGRQLPEQRWDGNLERILDYLRDRVTEIRTGRRRPIKFPKDPPPRG